MTSAPYKLPKYRSAYFRLQECSTPSRIADENPVMKGCLKASLTSGYECPESGNSFRGLHPRWHYPTKNALLVILYEKSLGCGLARWMPVKYLKFQMLPLEPLPHSTPIEKAMAYLQRYNCLVRFRLLRNMNTRTWPGESWVWGSFGRDPPPPPPTLIPII